MGKIICPQHCADRSATCHATCAHYVAYSILNCTGENAERARQHEYSDYKKNVIHKEYKKNGNKKLYR